MYLADVSLNIMSLGGLALGVGMLVDNAIVVLESIDRFRKRNHSHADAADKGTSEVAQAVIASTLTTVCVFVPIIFVEGIAGQLFNDQALTVTFSLLASLMVALTLIPMLSSRQFQPNLSPEPAMSGSSSQNNSKLSRILSSIFVDTPAILINQVRIIFSTIGKLLNYLLKPIYTVFDATLKKVDHQLPAISG